MWINIIIFYTRLLYRQFQFSIPKCSVHWILVSDYDFKIIFFRSRLELFFIFVVVLKILSQGCFWADPEELLQPLHQAQQARQRCQAVGHTGRVLDRIREAQSHPQPESGSAEAVHQGLQGPRLHSRTSPGIGSINQRNRSITMFWWKQNENYI